MIRNIFIIKNGIPLVVINFGACHSLGNDDDLISGFIYVFGTFSRELTGDMIKIIDFESYKMYFYEDKTNLDLLFVFIYEVNIKSKAIEFKIRKVVSLFNEKYSQRISEFDGNITYFNDFKNILLEMNLAQKNCGGHPECEGCSNSNKTLSLLTSFKNDKNGFLHRLKSFFKKQ